MNKNYLIIFFVLLWPVEAITSTQVNSLKYSEFFSQIREATAKSIWQHDLYGPILLVDPKSREIFANFPDNENALKRVGSIYTGRLPEKINIANTTVRWSGKQWAMIMLPLPEKTDDKVNLVVHELFHRAQEQLGFNLSNANNAHLDKMEGRILLRLELEALKSALSAEGSKMVQTHVVNALALREQRYAIFENAKSKENELELNEGLAEYTGLLAAQRSTKNTKRHLVAQIEHFVKSPSFVRSFAYQTIPAYGYLLQFNDSYWNQDVTQSTNLIELFKIRFDFKGANVDSLEISALTSKYNGRQILQEEEKRKAHNDRVVADYRRVLIENSPLKINFENMNISFDPGNLVSLEGRGTVYPNLRVTDNWGVLEVTEGALMSHDWSNLQISKPTEIKADKVLGNGWSLNLSKGYQVVKAKAGDHYLLSRK